MTQKHHQAVTGYDLCNIRTRLDYEEILNSLIFPDLSCYVDISPRNDILSLRACCYLNSRITLYVPSKLSLTVDQMIDVIRSAYKSDTPWLTDQIIRMEKDPEENARLKKLLNGKTY